MAKNWDFVDRYGPPKYIISHKLQFQEDELYVVQEKSSTDLELLNERLNRTTFSKVSKLYPRQGKWAVARKYRIENKNPAFKPKSSRAIVSITNRVYKPTYSHVQRSKGEYDPDVPCSPHKRRMSYSARYYNKKLSTARSPDGAKQGSTQTKPSTQSQGKCSVASGNKSQGTFQKVKASKSEHRPMSFLNILAGNMSENVSTSDLNTDRVSIKTDPESDGYGTEDTFEHSDDSKDDQNVEIRSKDSNKVVTCSTEENSYSSEKFEEDTSSGSDIQRYDDNEDTRSTESLKVESDSDESQISACSMSTRSNEASIPNGSNTSIQNDNTGYSGKKDTHSSIYTGSSSDLNGGPCSTVTYSRSTSAGSQSTFSERTNSTSSNNTEKTTGFIDEYEADSRVSDVKDTLVKDGYDELEDTNSVRSHYSFEKVNKSLSHSQTGSLSNNIMTEDQPIAESSTKNKIYIKESMMRSSTPKENVKNSQQDLKCDFLSDFGSRVDIQRPKSKLTSSIHVSEYGGSQTSISSTLSSEREVRHEVNNRFLRDHGSIKNSVSPNSSTHPSSN